VRATVLAAILGLLATCGVSDAQELPPRTRPSPIPPDPLFPDPLPASTREPGTWPQGPGISRDDNRAPRYRVWNYEDRRIREGGDLGLLTQQLDVPFPILLNDRDILAGSFQLRHTYGRTAATLPDTGRPFPRQLWDINVSLAYVHRFEDGVSVGIIPKFGSPSDKPFSSFDTLYAGVVGFVRIPAAYPGDYWNFGVIYSPNSILPYPIPGVSYEFNPDPDLRVGLGVPFSVLWRFAPDWRVEFNYRPITLIHSQVTYEPRNGFQVYGGFDWDNEGYYTRGRLQSRDLFFRDEKRIFGGVRVDVAERVSLDLSGGYAFDRTFGEGRSSLSLNYDKIHVAAGGYLSAWLLIPF
jgi:hypothetical protein